MLRDCYYGREAIELISWAKKHPCHKTALRIAEVAGRVSDRFVYSHDYDEDWDWIEKRYDKIV